MTIRLLSPDDVPAYRALRLECTELASTATWASYEEESVVPLATMALRLEAGPYQAMMGAFDGDRLVAMASFRRDRQRKIAHRGEIWGVYLTPSARGTGVARRLMEALIAHAHTIPGVIQLRLGVRSDNVAAKALYGKLGFVVTGVDPRSMWADGAYHDEDQMLLDLDAG